AFPMIDLFPRNSHFEAFRKFSPCLASATPELRYQLVRDEFTNLLYDALCRDRSSTLPQASNTYSSSLITQFLLDGAVTVLQHKWPALKVFSRDFSPDPYKPRSTAQLKTVASADTSVQQDATNFESGDSTVNNTQVTVSQYTSAFNVTNDQLNSGL